MIDLYMNNFDKEKVANALMRFYPEKRYSYNHQSILESNYAGLEYNRVFICIYMIPYSETHPFLLYLLYKYPDTNTVSFPMVNIKDNNVEESSTALVNDITNEKLIPEGYIKFNGNVYMFYNYNKEYKKQRLTEKNELWWSSIYEVCNTNRVLNYPIHHTVYNLFYNYRSLVYLEDNISTPMIVYATSASMGDANLFGITKTTFEDSMKYVVHTKLQKCNNLIRILLFVDKKNTGINSLEKKIRYDTDNNILHFDSSNHFYIISNNH
jgi:hypothetical protein